MRKKKSELPTCFNFVSMFFIVIIPTSYCLLPAELGSNVAAIMEAGVGGCHCLCSWRYTERRRRPVKHRRGETRRRARDAAARASGRVITCGFFFFKPTHADAAPTWADSHWIRPTRAWIGGFGQYGRIGRNRRFRLKFKKKGCKMHRLN